MTFENWTCPVPLRDQTTIVMGHGGGGKLSSELIRHMFVPVFEDEALAELADAAVLDLPAGRVAFSTDSFVVRPRFFPGGNIGELAINGTINDIATTGARPFAISVGLILEEGLALAELGVIIDSMAAAAKRAGVRLVTGDTKVVDRGHGDGVYINTTGIGVLGEGVDIHPKRARSGDSVLVTGTIGDHGMAIMSVREGLGFESEIVSDTAPLHGVVAALLEAAIDVHVVRDPTRGGLAASLNEIAMVAGVGIELDETSVPVRRPVASACEMLGMDPMHVANEGKYVVIVPGESEQRALEVMRGCEFGERSAVVGRVVERHPGMVVARTALGAHRVVDTLTGEQLPRIC